MAWNWLRLLCRLNRHQPALYRVGHNVGKECSRCGRHLLLTPQEVLSLFGQKVKKDPNELAKEKEERKACPWLNP